MALILLFLSTCELVYIKRERIFLGLHTDSIGWVIHKSHSSLLLSLPKHMKRQVSISILEITLSPLKFNFFKAHSFEVLSFNLVTNELPGAQLHKCLRDTIISQKDSLRCSDEWVNLWWNKHLEILKFQTCFDHEWFLTLPLLTVLKMDRPGYRREGKERN